MIKENLNLSKNWKKGDKIICIRTEGLVRPLLTMNKLYIVENSFTSVGVFFVDIISDENKFTEHICSSRFVSIQKRRSEKIKKLKWSNEHRRKKIKR